VKIIYDNFNLFQTALELGLVEEGQFLVYKPENRVKKVTITSVFYTEDELGREVCGANLSDGGLYSLTTNPAKCLTSLDTPDGRVDFYSDGRSLSWITEEKKDTLVQVTKENPWGYKISQLCKDLKVDSLPESIKYKSFSDEGKHHNVFYTEWGSVPPEGAIITYNGSKKKNKAWIKL
jgi:hypothetical protein